MEKVIVFGKFDEIKSGHIYFLKKAKKLGHLTIVLLKDIVVRKSTGNFPVNTETKRVKALRDWKIADEIVLSDTTGFIDAAEKLKPDIICLGYNQKNLKEELESEILIKNLNIELKVMSEYKKKNGLEKSPSVDELIGSN